MDIAALNLECVADLRLSLEFVRENGAWHRATVTDEHDSNASYVAIRDYIRSCRGSVSVASG